jgi:uncharacterized membrane protein (DUF4010 family)
MDEQREMAARLAIAGLIGLAAGLEREWSGHASGPDARFAGIRTFFLLGLFGAIAGTLVSLAAPYIATALVAGGAALCVVAYWVAVKKPSSSTDGTTEAAALTIIALGVLAGLGFTGLAAGAGAVVVLMLSEKSRLHWLVGRLTEPELRAGLQFAVLAVVVLPLLPSGPYFGDFAVRPRALWTLVLLFSALSFGGFVARRKFGAGRGFRITGALGGLVSSTAVTLTFSRLSQGADDIGGALARGVLAACAVLIPRVIIVSAALNPAVALALVPTLAPALVVALAFALWGGRGDQSSSHKPEVSETSPLRLPAAIQLAVAFQIAMIAVALGRRYWGATGVYTGATLLGLTDVDALTVSMSRSEANLEVAMAARAITIGVLSNTIVKLGLALVLGRRTFRRRTATGLALLAGASAVGILLA